jgi:hypothetical protein
MAQPPQGSVFPNHRLSPSGPQLSGDGGPIIQIGFDQCIFSDPSKPVWEIQDGLVNPLDPADILANAIIARDTSLTDGGPPPSATNIPKTNRLGVTLSKVKADSLIGAWFSFGFSSVDPNVSFLVTTALGLEDEDGNQAFVGFSNQNVVEVGAAPLAVATGSALSLGPNPLGAVGDVTVYPVAFCIDQDVLVQPGLNQVAIMVAEFAKT